MDIDIKNEDNIDYRTKVLGSFNDMVSSVTEFFDSQLLDVPIRIVLSDFTFDRISEFLQKTYIRNKQNVVVYEFEYRGITFQREHYWNDIFNFNT